MASPLPADYTPNIDGIALDAVQCQVGRVRGADGSAVKVLIGADNRVFQFIRTIRGCLMGKVRAAVACTTEGGSFTASTDPRARVAIKEVSKDCIRRRVSLEGRPLLENPIRELKVLKYLSTPGHPNIVRLIAIYVDAENVYIVMEYIDGKELYDIVAETVGPDNAAPVGLGEARAKRYFAQCIEATRYMRSKHIAHLDLSLENAMLEAATDMVKVIDFGVAVATDGAGGRASGPVGKDGYMAPEVRAGREYNCFAADLWCVGVMGFAMLAGVPPWEQADVSSDAFRIAAGGRFPDLIRHWGFDKRMSPPAQEVMIGMLTADPAARMPFDAIVGHEWLAEFRAPAPAPAAPGTDGAGSGSGSGAGAAP